MLSVLRFLAFGWLFALVLLAAWLGMLVPPTPTPTPPATGAQPEPDPTADPTAAVGTVGSGPADPAGVPSGRPSGHDPAAASTEPTCVRFDVAPVAFEPGAAVLGPESQDDLAAFVLRLRSAPCVADTVGMFCPPDRIEVMVAGHTDPVPSSLPGGNARLSFDRGLAVALELAGAGVTIRSVEGYGDTQPVAGVGLGPGLGHDRRADLSLWCPRRLDRPGG